MSSPGVMLFMSLYDMDGVSKKVHRNEEWLKDKINEGLSQNEMAREAGTGRGAIREQLSKYNLKTDGYTPKEVGLSYGEIEIIVGATLGDASIQGRGKKTARFRLDDTYKEYLMHLKDACPSILGESSVKKKNNQDIYYINSVTCADLERVRQSLYWENNKIYPVVMNITQTILKHWYIGDGNLHKGKRPRIACNWLGEYKAHMAKKMIADKIGVGEDVLSVRGPYYRDGRDNPDIEIAINSGGVSQFFDYIGGCPVDCYKYKWA